MQALALGHTGSSGDSVPAVHHRIPYTMSGHDYSQTTTAIPSLKKAVHAQRTVGAWLAPAQSASPSGSRSGALRRAARSLGARASMRQKDILAILEVAALTRESLIVLIAAGMLVAVQISHLYSLVFGSPATPALADLGFLGLELRI